VIFGRAGDVEHGVVMLRTAQGTRALARVPAQAGATLAHLMNMDRAPIGSIGDISTAYDGILEWRVRD
jgi:acetyl-CoA C-acetyltransferase